LLPQHIRRPPVPDDIPLHACILAYRSAFGKQSLRILPGGDKIQPLFSIEELS